MEPRVIFISSSGRSGSKSVASALNLPGILSIHGAKPQIERANCLHYRGDLKHPARVVLDARAKIIRNTVASGMHYVECTWFLSSLGGVLKSAFPGERIVHLVRDGRDFVRSGMARPWFKGDRRYLAREWSWSRDRWNPPQAATSRLAKIAWLWSVQQSRIAADADELIRFEDLVDNGLPLEKIGLPLHRVVTLPRVNVTQKHVMPPWQSWNATTRAEFQRWAGHELQFYGYAW